MAIVALDLKRVIALSTCSHIALVLSTVGIGMPSIGLLHILLHACAKAALFMTAGALIHAHSNDQDLRALSSAQLLVVHPLLALTLLGSMLSLSGLPGLSGALSKDALVDVL